MCGLSFALAMSHHDGSGFGLGGSVAAWTEFDYGNSMSEVLTPLVLLTAVAVRVGGVFGQSPVRISFLHGNACRVFVLRLGVDGRRHFHQKKKTLTIRHRS